MTEGIVSVTPARKVRKSLVSNEVRGFFGRPRHWEKLALAAQRVTGVGILIYLIFHVFVTGTVASGSASWTGTMNTLHNPIADFGELLVVVGAVFHAVNGIRVMLLELSPLVGKPARPDYPYKPTSLGRGQRSILYVGLVMSVLAIIGAGLALWG